MNRMKKKNDRLQKIKKSIVFNFKTLVYINKQNAQKNRT